MKEISGNSTYTTKYGLPLIVAIGTLIILGYIIFSDYKIEDYKAPALILLFIFLAWFINYRKLETVFIDKNDLVVRGKKILITDVISMKRNPPNYIYTVKYYDGTEIKSFKVTIDTMFLRTPEYMKRLEALVEKNKTIKPQIRTCFCRLSTSLQLQKKSALICQNPRHPHLIISLLP